MCVGVVGWCGGKNNLKILLDDTPWHTVFGTGPSGTFRPLKQSVCDECEVLQHLLKQEIEKKHTHTHPHMGCSGLLNHPVCSLQVCHFVEIT